LKALARWHFIYALLAILSGVAALVFLMIGVGQAVEMSHQGGHSGRGGCSLALAFLLIGVFNTLWGVTIGVSGLLIRIRLLRLASCALAILCCFAFPLGTLLGVYTLNVLSRPSIKALYAR
jgi:hypothetical protein